MFNMQVLHAVFLGFACYICKLCMLLVRNLIFSGLLFACYRFGSCMTGDRVLHAVFLVFACYWLKLCIFVV